MHFTKGKAMNKLLVALLLAALAALDAHADDKSPANSTPPSAQSASSVSTALSNDKHYVNKDGNEVHSPAKTANGQAPAGATARCGDGSYSFSQHRSGTCSHHGGVATWLQ